MKTASHTSRPVELTGRRGVQKLRFFSQLFSVFINLWIGLQFYLFVVYIESGGRLFDVARPPGVEGWLPIGAIISLRSWWETGIINEIHPAGLIILIVILASALIFKKGFCSWICPVGFISEMLGNIADKIWRKRIKPPKWADWLLRSLKYLLLGFFLYALLIQMSAADIESFLYTDYNKVSDLLMLRFFTDISMLSLTIIGLLITLSLVVRGFWCRYLCPYGGLLGLLALLSPSRIVRNSSLCTDCSSCSTACPSFIKVERVEQVISDECTGCMACVDACPVGNALELVVVQKKRPVSPLIWSVALLVLFWGSLLVFKTYGPWENGITHEEYMRHMPAVTQGQYRHP